MKIALTFTEAAASTVGSLSLDTVDAIARFLRRHGHLVHMISTSGSLTHFVGRVESARAQLVINTVSGPLYAPLFDALGLAHTGPESLDTSAEDLERVLRNELKLLTPFAAVPHKPAQVRVGLAHNVKRVDPASGDDVDAEFDSPATIAAITTAIEALGHEVIPLEATPALPRIISESDIDVVFNIAEGLEGRAREAQVPALLELLGIPYTGSDAATLAVTLDKGLAKRIVSAAGLPTARWAVVEPGGVIPTHLTLPLIVKPNAEGSSKGITQTSVVRTVAELEAAVRQLHDRYRSGALLEEFLTGREFTVGLLGGGRPTVLPLMEIMFLDPNEALPVYSFAHKTEADPSVRFDVPARVEPALATRIESLALDCFEALGCRDVARIDIRLDASGTPHFIECNPLPGLSPGFSDLCVAAEQAGITHANLIARILAPALLRRRVAETEGS